MALNARWSQTFGRRSLFWPWPWLFPAILIVVMTLAVMLPHDVCR